MSKYTSEQLAALRTAIAAGVLTVRSGDSSTTYQNLTEMRRLEQEMARDVEGSPRVKKVVGVYKSGV